MKESFEKSFRKRLDDKRKALGMNQREFAEFLGVKKESVESWLSGTTPKADKLKLISHKCNVSVDWLLGEQEVETKDLTVKEICEYTGLNQETVEELHRIKTSYYQDMEEYSSNYSDDFFDLLNVIVKYADIEEIVQLCFVLSANVNSIMRHRGEKENTVLLYEGDNGRREELDYIETTISAIDLQRFKLSEYLTDTLNVFLFDRYDCNYRDYRKLKRSLLGIRKKYQTKDDEELNKLFVTEEEGEADD